MTTCIHGHEMTPENTYQRPRGSAECRKCRANQLAGFRLRVRRPSEGEQRVSDTSWMVHAACAGLDSHAFFPEVGRIDLDKYAKRICEQCPVVNQCLTYALEHREWGIWGNTNEHDRDKIYSQRRRSRKKAA